MIKIQYFYELHYCILLFEGVTHTDDATATHTSEVYVAIALKTLYMGLVTFTVSHNMIFVMILMKAGQFMENILVGVTRTYVHMQTHTHTHCA